MRDILADLRPPLGYPGGSCHLIDRAVDSLGSRSESIVQTIEEGEKFSKPQEQKVYRDRLEGKVKGTGFKFMALTPHSQYRMDQRSINEVEVRGALRDFWKQYSKDSERWAYDRDNSQLIPWVYSGLRVVFAFVTMRRVTGAQIITVVDEGEKDPGPMLRQDCKGWGGWSKQVPLPEGVNPRLEKLKLASRVAHLWGVRVAASGDCYEANGKKFMSEAIFPGKSPNLRLVHGEVTGQGSLAGVNYGHAWIEDGNTVIDVSNGKNLRVPKAIYYAIGGIDRNDNMHKYKPSEFRKKVQKYEHWGPWDLRTTTGL